MSTKSFLLSLFAIMMATAVSVCCVSCGDDDDTNDKNPPNGETPDGIVGTWSVSGIADDEGYEYTYAGTMTVTSSTLALDFHEEATGDRGAFLKGNCSIAETTLRWTLDGESETFSYVLSEDQNTLTMTYVSGRGIDGWVIKTLTGKRVGSTQEKPSGELAALLKGTWYSAYLITEGNTVYIESEPNGPLDGFYQEFTFEDDGRATLYAWSGDDTWEALPFAYKVEGNTVTADFADFINIDGEYDSTLRHVFTYDSESNQLIWHTFSYDGDDAGTKIDMDVYFNKK